MKKTLFLALMMAMTMSVNAQTKSTDDKVYDKCEVLPEYPGGYVKMFEYLRDSMKYPEQAAKEKIEGKVLVAFIVEKNGTLTDIHVVSPVHPQLDAEAIRVVKSMPKWKPGTVKDKPVRVKFTLPVAYRLK